MAGRECEDDACFALDAAVPAILTSPCLALAAAPGEVLLESVSCCSGVGCWWGVARGGEGGSCPINPDRFMVVSMLLLLSLLLVLELFTVNACCCWICCNMTAACCC